MKARRQAAFGALDRLPGRAMGTLDVAFLADEPRRLPFSALRVRMKPGARHEELHHVRTTELFLVVKGSVATRVDGRRRVLRKGDFAVLPPGCRHAFRAGPRGVEVLVVFAPAMDFRAADIVLDE